MSLRTLGLLVAIATSGCRSVVPLDTQLKETLAGKDGRTVGRLDADLYARSKEDGYSGRMRFRGVVDDTLCFRLTANFAGSDRSQVRDNSNAYQNILKKAKAVVRSHDTLDGSTRWDQPAENDLRSVTRTGAELTDGQSNHAVDYDGGYRKFTDGIFEYEICTAMPEVTPSTRYLTLQLTRDGDPWLYIWRIDPPEVESEIEAGGGDEAPTDEPATDEPPASQPGATASSVIAGLQATGHHTTLLDALARTGVDAELANGDFTLLAATDAAFERLNDRRRDKLLADTDKLTEYLREHIIIGAYPPDAVPPRAEVKTLAGKKLVLLNDEGRFRFGKFDVTRSPITTPSVVIYAIDKVIP